MYIPVSMMLQHAACLESGSLGSTPCPTHSQTTDAKSQQPTLVSSREIVNCAGLHTWDVAQCVEGYDTTYIPPRYYARGSYFWLRNFGHRFSHLVYPMAERGGLGVHLTIDLAGGLGLTYGGFG